MKTENKSEKRKSFRDSTLWEYIQVFAVAFFLVFGFMRPFLVEAFKIPSGSMENTLLIGDRILVAKFMYGTTIPFVKRHRCTIGIEFEPYLKRATRERYANVSEDLRRELKDKGIELSPNAAVSVLEVNKKNRDESLEWLITDGEESYNVKKKGDKLKVYTTFRILDFHKPSIGDIFVFKPPPGAEKTQSFIKRIVGLPGDVIEVKDGELYRNGQKVTGETYIKRDTQNLPKVNQRNIHSRDVQRILEQIETLQNMEPFTIPPGHVFAMGDNRDKSSDSRKWGTVPIQNIKGQAFLTYWSWDGSADLLHKIRFSRIGRMVK